MVPVLCGRPIGQLPDTAFLRRALRVSARLCTTGAYGSLFMFNERIERIARLYCALAFGLYLYSLKMQMFINCRSLYSRTDRE